MREIYLLNGGYREGTKSVSTFEIEYLTPPFIPVSYDAVIFSSKNAVFGIDRIWSGWKNLSSYSIGEGTSKFIEELGGNVCYEARNSYADEFACEVIPFLVNKKVLFPRAKKVASDIAGILKNGGVDIDDIVVYQTKCCDKQDDIFEDNAILIFTSPSCVKCFFKLFEWRDSFTAVVIGEKTSAMFPFGIKPLVSPKQTIDSCITLAQTLSKNYI